MNGMLLDIVYDFFEGVVCEVKINVIKVCVLEGFFDFEYLNDRIIKLKFLEVEKSNKLLKVINIFRKQNIKQLVV